LFFHNFDIRFFGRDVKSKIGVKECALVNSIIPFFLLPFMLPATGEYKQWPSVLFRPHAKVGIPIIIAALSFALMESKHVDRYAKYAIVENTSTLFFAGIDSAMKMLAGIMSFILFPSNQSQISWSTILGFSFVSMGVVLLYFDKRAKSKIQYKKVLPVSVEMKNLPSEETPASKESYEVVGKENLGKVEGWKRFTFMNLST
jgi:hypothetical protein